MNIDTKGLRKDKRPQSSRIVHALLDRLEAAEADALEQARLNGMGASREAALLAKLEAAEKDRANFLVEMGRLCAQCDAAERERDECNRRRLEAADHFAAQTALMKKKYDAMRAELDALRGQKDEALNTLCKVFHAGEEFEGPDGMIMAVDLALWNEGCEAIERLVGGEEDGASPYARPVPAPSVPGGWLRAIDEALVVTHLGVANAEDSYEDAKRKLDALIGWHCDVVTDPAVNGGWKLVPVEILDRFPEINQNNYNHDDVCNLNAWGVELVLAAAPEAKP